MGNESLTRFPTQIPTGTHNLLVGKKLPVEPKMLFKSLSSTRKLLAGLHQHSDLALDLISTAQKHSVCNKIVAVRLCYMRVMPTSRTIEATTDDKPYQQKSPSKTVLPIVSYPLRASQPPPVYVFDLEHPPAGVLRLGASPGYNNTSEWRVYQAGCRYKEWPNGIQRRIAIGQLVYARSMVPVGPDNTSYVILYGEVTDVKRIMKNWVVFTDVKRIMKNWVVFTSDKCPGK
ncbi:hypothetical protein BV25DRAFT_1837641 [Artomyces pyxidatus]|uniref:Uncharacterized protein n=1 Tax=Artomyces pyxidatus TaxID=48021 RepID=A0ACB8T4Q0_9AGAM|nr:hypothetical protein BV25DRAFT_1837641 [Artomyces pyxidatus]